MTGTAIGIFFTFLARIGAALGGVLLNLAVARVFGAEAIGSFAVFLSLLGALGILARRGQDSLLMRSVAWCRSDFRASTAVALLRLGLWRVLWPSLVFGAAGAVLLATNWFGTPFPGAIVTIPVALPLLVGLALVSGYSKGMSRSWLAPFFEMGGISLIAAFLLGLLGAIHIAPEPKVVMSVFVSALALLAFIAVAMMARDRPRVRRIPRLTNSERRELETGQVAFTIIGLATFLTQAGSFLLAAPFLSQTDLGLLRAAERLALLVSFPVLAINPVIAPRIVQLVRGGESAHLPRFAIRAMLTSAGMGAPMLLFLLICPDFVLTLIGVEFIQAEGYLRIMAQAQFVAALLGPLVMVLNMSGHERAAMWINLGALVLGLALIPALSAIMGARGFILAYSAVIVVRLGVIAATVLVAHVRQWQQAPLT